MLVVVGVVRVVHIQIVGIDFRRHLLHQVLRHGSKRARSSRRAGKSYGTGNRRILNTVGSLDRTGEGGQGSKQIRFCVLRTVLVVPVIRFGLDVGRSDGGKHVQKALCGGFPGGLHIGQRCALLGKPRNGGRLGGSDADFGKCNRVQGCSSGHRGNRSSRRLLNRTVRLHRGSERERIRLSRRRLKGLLGQRLQTRRFNNPVRRDPRVGNVHPIGRTLGIGLLRKSLFLNLTGIQERRHGNIAHRGNLTQVELCDVDRRGGDSSEGVCKLLGDVPDRRRNLNRRGGGGLSSRSRGSFGCGGLCGLRIVFSRLFGSLRLNGSHGIDNRLGSSAPTSLGAVFLCRDSLRGLALRSGNALASRVRMIILLNRLDGRPLRSLHLMNDLTTGIHRLLQFFFDDVVRLSKMPRTFLNGGIECRSVAGTLHRLFLGGVLLSLRLCFHKPCGHARGRNRGFDALNYRLVRGLGLRINRETGGLGRLNRNFLRFRVFLLGVRHCFIGVLSIGAHLLNRHLLNFAGTHLLFLGGAVLGL